MSIMISESEEINFLQLIDVVIEESLTLCKSATDRFFVVFNDGGKYKKLVGASASRIIDCLPVNLKGERGDDNLAAAIRKVLESPDKEKFKFSVKGMESKYYAVWSLG